MKKRTKFLAIGMGLAIAVCGGALVACGGDDAKSPSGGSQVGVKSDYYLMGTSSGSLFAEVGDYAAIGDAEGIETRADLPDELFFVTTKNKNEYTITVNLYENDEIGILIASNGEAGNAWSGQMGYNTMEMVSADGTAYFSQGGGFDTKNIKVDQDGSYTLVLSIGGGEFGMNKLTYSRTEDYEKLVKGVALDQTDAILNVGDTLDLTATINPTDAADQSLTWKSSNEDIATVSATGTVTAVALGEGDVDESIVTITVTTGNGKTASCVITVIPEGVEAVKLESLTLSDDTALALHIGDTIDNRIATKSPENATGSVSYSSSNDAVAEVDPITGEVTIVGAGTATITAGLQGKAVSYDITVGRDFYITGNISGAFSWPGTKASYAALTAEDSPYDGWIFTEQKDGTYKLEEVTLSRGDQFAIVFLGMPDSWAGALKLDAIAQDEEDPKFGEAGGNVLVLDSAKYTFTINKAGAVVSFEIVEDLEDATYDAIAIEAWGTGNGWANAYEIEIDDAAEANDYTVEITMTLAASETFQFRSYNGGDTTGGVSLYIAQLNSECEGLSIASGNIACSAAGDYKFTLVFNKYGELVSVTAVAVDAE